MTLHDWIDELCDVLDVETEVDDGLVLDVARDAAHGVERPAAPLTTYLLGFAAGRRNAGPEEIERLAAAASALADRWGREQDVDEDDGEALDLGNDDDEDQLIDVD